MKQRAKWTRPFTGLILIAVMVGQFVSAAEDPAVTRTRNQVLMLDDLYKTVIVLVTKHYVTSPAIVSAATAGKLIFAAMKEKGWHEVRLLGLTDQITNPENKPADAFEKAAKKSLLAGQASYEEVVSEGGKQYLRMATAIPVVMPECVMCHSNFKDNKGVIGSLSYKVPLVQ